MTEVYIEYNPLRLQTVITVDGQVPAATSRLHVGERRLQEWVDDLPRILCEECGSHQFGITFHGTLPDYEDMVAMVDEARATGVEMALDYRPAQDIANKEAAISQLFQQIQEGPFAELKQPDIIQAFEAASNRDFRVSVVATMSAGKSTLINAFLQRRLMPARHEACTAIITEIKDNDCNSFCAHVYNKEGVTIETCDGLTLADMERFNANPEVSTIKVAGNIPFVASGAADLVLIDTPGPNNSRDLSHRQATQRLLLDSAKPLVLYILNATQLAVDDDNCLLQLVADSMRVGGKQSRDRFIFVLNKLDEFKKGEDSVTSALSAARDYLAGHGIENPNIFPASALTALSVRTVLNNASTWDYDSTILDEAEVKVRKMNHNEELHCEQYAPLPASVQARVKAGLDKAVAEGDRNEQALIHSGIVSLEEAICLYVGKYAQTSKIKNVVDTFRGKIEAARSFALAEEQIRQNEARRQEIVERIAALEDKLKSGDEAKKLKDEILGIDCAQEINDAASSIVQEMQGKIREAALQDTRLSESEAIALCDKLKDLARKIEADVQVRLENVVATNVLHQASRLLEIYKEKLSSLVDEVDVGGITINPFTLMAGELPHNTNDLLSDASVSETVRTGKIWVENPGKKWWKPWTWFWKSGYYVDLYEDCEYIDGAKLVETILVPVEEQLQESKLAAVEYAKKQAEVIKADFARKFAELDQKLLVKLGELKSCAHAEKTAEEQVLASQRKLAWLNSIISQIDAILDI